MRNKTFQTLLNEGLNRLCDKVAIECGNRKVTYKNLQHKSNYIANWIINKGIERQTFIGMLIDDRVTLIAVMLGIIKAGCVFVPLDPINPQDRLEKMLDFTNTRLIFSDKGNITKFKESKGLTFISSDDIFTDRSSPWWTDTPNIVYSGEDKIYIYFTSGSTGKPRALLGKNKGLLHFIKWEIETFAVNETFRFSQFISPGFDAFLRDAFTPLCAAASICIPDSAAMLEPAKLVRWIDTMGINLIHCTPTLFRFINKSYLSSEHFGLLKYIFLSGEKIHPKDLADWFNVFDERIQLLNLWGTSETTMAKTCHFIKKTDVQQERIPVGKAINGSMVIILDKNMNICDVEIVGDIYIRTPFRTFGYLNDPELNNHKFIPNPFNNNPNDLLHKTGDLGRFLADENLDVIGREDRQVKIRGIRIELEEIENQLRHHPRVGEVVVKKITTSSGNEFLCAYVTTRESGSHGEEEALANDLRAFMLPKLPAYMVPTTIIKMEKIPRTPNDKVDYNRLPDPVEKEKEQYLAPRNELERKLLELWCKILQLPQLGVCDHFFESGGNSLTLMTLINEIHKEFHVRLSLGEVFKNLTIEKQAQVIRKTDLYKYCQIDKTEKKEYYAALPVQGGMYVLQQIEPGNLGYNICSCGILIGDIKKYMLEESIKKMIQWYETLRTSFHMIDGRLVQRIHDHVDFDIEYYKTEDPESPGMIIKKFVRPFDLSRAPLFRLGLIETAPNEHIFILDIHHIITDGISQAMFFRRIIDFYNGIEPLPLNLQYKDYCEWQNQEEQKILVSLQKEYWLKELQGNLPLLNLPIDYPRPPEQSFEGDKVIFNSNKEKIDRLKEFALEMQVTLYMLCLAIFYTLLYKITGQEDIILGTDTSGRRHADLQDLIGMFVNTIVLRNYPTGHKTFISFLQDVKDRTLAAFDNQDYPFKELLEQLNLKRDVRRNPIFDVAFFYADFTAAPAAAATPAVNDRIPLILKPYRREDNTSKFDLTLHISETVDSLFFIFEYCTRIFRKEKIEALAVLYSEVVDIILLNPEIKLGDIELSLSLLAIKNKEVQLDELDF